MELQKYNYCKFTDVKIEMELNRNDTGNVSVTKNDEIFQKRTEKLLERTEKLFGMSLIRKEK